MSARRLSLSPLVALSLSLSLPIAASLPASARAQAAPAGNFSSRSVGFGAGLHFGNTWVREGSSHIALPLPSLSLTIPVASFAALDLWIPAASLVIGNLSREALPWVWFDVFARFHPISRVPGLFVAPGLGFMYLTVDERYRGVVLEVPVRVGYELSPADRVGLTFAARPFVDYVFPLSAREGNYTYGIFVEVGVTLYTLKQR